MLPALLFYHPSPTTEETEQTERECGKKELRKTKKRYVEFSANEFGSFSYFRPGVVGKERSERNGKGVFLSGHWRDGGHSGCPPNRAALSFTR